MNQFVSIRSDRVSAYLSSLGSYYGLLRDSGASADPKFQLRIDTFLENLRSLTACNSSDPASEAA